MQESTKIEPRFKLIALLLVFLILAMFSTISLLEHDLSLALARDNVLADIIALLPGAFHRFGVYLTIAFVFGAGTIFMDRNLERTSRTVFLTTAVIVSLCLGWLVTTRVLQFPICGDDSYIDFRYVRNWLSGSSFDYNPGAKVIGFTSHIHLIVLYLTCLISKSTDVALVSQMINVVFQLVNFSIIYFFSLDVFKRRESALAAICLYSLDPYGIQQTVFGKETHILVCFLLLSIWSMFKNRIVASAWLTSIMPFIRPEAVIWWFLVLIFNFKQSKKKALIAYIPPCMLVLLAVLGLYFLFGTVVPHGMVGKFKMFYPMMPGFMFFNTLWMIGTGIILPRFYLDVPGIAYALSAMLFGILTLVFAFRFLKQEPFRWYFVAVLVFMVIFGIKNPAPFGWYHCWYSLIPIFIGAAIVPALIDKLKDNSSSSPKLKKVLAGIVLAILVSTQIGQQFTRPRLDMTAFTFAWNNEFRRLIQFGYALDKMKEFPGSQTATIGAPEIGYIGYKHQGDILDFCGLLSPEVVKYGRLPESFQGKGEVLEINPAIVKDLKPPYIITLEAFGRELLKDDFFVSNYEKVGSWKNEWANSDGIFLYRLRK